MLGKAFACHSWLALVMAGLLLAMLGLALQLAGLLLASLGVGSPCRFCCVWAGRVEPLKMGWQVLDCLV